MMQRPGAGGAGALGTPGMPAAPMRVLMVTPRVLPYVGGIETHVYEVSVRMARRGIKVTVLSTDVSRRLPESEMIEEGVHFLRVPGYPAGKDYYYAPDMRRIIEKPGRWDIVHCQGVQTLVPLLALRAAQHAHIPYVLTFHAGGDVTAARGAMRRLQWHVLRPLLARASRLIGVSNDEAASFQRALRLPPDLFTIIPNGASHLPVRVSTRTPRQGEPQILSVGRLERYKGHQRVIEAMPSILRRYPNAHLRIVGSGSYENELRKLADDLHIASRVEIGAVPPGDTEGMAQAYLMADVVTLLSEHEGEGLVVLEALGCQRPVVVAYATALRQFVDRQWALGVALESTSEDIATAVLRQYERPLLPERFEPPSWEDCADRLLAVYGSAVRSGGSGLLPVDAGEGDGAPARISSALRSPAGVLSGPIRDRVYRGDDL